jgi:hypothetical protein
MFIKKCLLFIVSAIVAQGVDDNGFDVNIVIEDNPLSVVDDNGVNVTVVNDNGVNVTVVDDSVNVTAVDDKGQFTIVDDDGHVTVVNGDGDYFTIVDDYRRTVNGGSVNVIMNKMMILSLLTLFV